MIIVGLTGSIATGKSTVGAMFSDHGIPVYEADELVHRLYAGPKAGKVEAAFPGTLIDGKIDRAKLSAFVVGNPENMTRLENIIHPLVREKYAEIADQHLQKKTDLIIFDIPLLLEKGITHARQTYAIDKIIVTFCSEDTLQQRVLARPNMTRKKFLALRDKQLPQAEKQKLADFTLDTGKPLETTRSEVEEIIKTLTAQAKAMK